MQFSGLADASLTGVLFSDVSDAGAVAGVTTMLLQSAKPLSGVRGLT